ncbi:hypothetical protein ACFVTC_22005 [Streptomyces sp. NPDC057950]|uniref:hypothetical protein n=1 Tax=Streptomyces sp. NPDC057950 TaxID=3346288 RepID=UPI0036E8FEC5
MADTHTTRARRTPCEWAVLTVLASLVLATGALVATFGPLLAVACDTCQDGVRTTGSTDALVLLALAGVPLVTLATVAGIFLSRGGAKAAGVGLGALMVLMVVLSALGHA